MDLNQGRPDQAPRPVPNPIGLRERHHAADADLRRQREPEVEAPGGRADPPFEAAGVHGLEIPRAEGHHCREMRLERRDTEVAPLQPQSLARELGRRRLVKIVALPPPCEAQSTGPLSDRREQDRPDPGGRPLRPRGQPFRARRSMNNQRPVGPGGPFPGGSRSDRGR